MILLIYSSFFLITINKPYIFMNTVCAELDSLVMMLMMFSMFVGVLIFSMNQTSLNWSEKFIYFSIFMLMILFMNMSFVIDSSLLFIFFLKWMLFQYFL